MSTLIQFLEEPLGRMSWLAAAAVMVTVGLHGLGGAGGMAFALFALVPLAMVLTGSRPLIGLLRSLVDRRSSTRG